MREIYRLALVVRALLVTDSLTLDFALLDVLASAGLTGAELARCSCCCG